MSYRAPEQPTDDPRSQPEPWVSTHTARWHTGEFFLIQDEHAMTGQNPFDTISIMGIDDASGRMFARTFENHGFSREYDVAVDGVVWTFTGEHERARIEFNPDGKTQTITWEWHLKDTWVPLCDRVAMRED